MIISVAINQLPDRYSKDIIQYRKHKDITKLTCYRRMKEYGELGYEYWKDLSDEDIIKDIKNFILLYKSIKSLGWKDEPYIKGKIYSDGSWRIVGGYHRLSILHYLKHKTVKVDWDIHPDFMKFYNVVNKRYKGNRIYQNVDHIVFSGCSCVRGKNRWELINQNIPKKSKILDIGSYLGDISLNLAKNRHTVRGIETDDNLVWASNYLIRAHKKPLKIDFICDNIINYFNHNKDSYNVIIMLSVDRWVKKNLGDKVLINLFKTISNRCDIFIFESRGRHEKIALRWIRRYTDLKHKELLGQDDGETKRNLWKFWK